MMGVGAVITKLAMTVIHDVAAHDGFRLTILLFILCWLFLGLRLINAAIVDQTREESIMIRFERIRLRISILS